MFGTAAFTNDIRVYLTTCILLLPLCGAVVIALCKQYEFVRNLAATLTGGGTFICSGLLLVRALQTPLVFGWPLFMGIGLHFRIDFFGAFFAFFSALIWFLAILYSQTYMSHQHAQTRYYVFLVLTLGGTLGVFLAGDLFTLFLFFEMMSLTSYVLVVHNETEEAMSAGLNYLYFCVAGGLSLLAGMMLLYSTTGTIALAPQLELLAGSGPVRYYIAALMITGFGIKAGMLPVHVWLPRAHPVAPSPASALLSGIMIKVGAYGIIRIFNLILTPAGPGPGIPRFTETTGYGIIWIAAATMFAGALMAIFQSNVKRLLAYSSISQMGYILFGIGCAAYLGCRGATGFAAFIYHILNHAFYKSGLFLMAGAVYARTGEQELPRLGGLARSSPVTAAAFFVAAAGLAGFPGFNGYISKTLLHHAITEAAAGALQATEYIFIFTGVLTACYAFRLFTGIFAGSKPAHLAGSGKETLAEQLIFAIFGAAVICLGLFPHTVIKRLILPAAAGLIQDGIAITPFERLRFLNAADLLGAALPIFAGLALLYAIRSRDLTNKIKLPTRLSVDRLLYNPLTRNSLALFTAAGKTVETAVDGFYLGVPVLCGRISHGLRLFEDRSLPETGHQIERGAALIREWLYRLWMYGINRVFGHISRGAKKAFRIFVRMDYRPQDSKFFRTINISNLGFDIVLIMICLLLIMGVLLLFNT